MAIDNVEAYLQASDEGCYIANAAFVNSWLQGERKLLAEIEQEVERDSTAKIAALSLVRTQAWLLRQGFVLDEYPQSSGPLYEYFEDLKSWPETLGALALRRNEDIAATSEIYDKEWIDEYKTVYPLQVSMLTAFGIKKYRRHSELLTPEDVVSLITPDNIAIGVNADSITDGSYHAVSLFKPEGDLLSMYSPHPEQPYITKLGVADNLPYAIDFNEPIELWSRP